MAREVISLLIFPAAMNSTLTLVGTIAGEVPLAMSTLLLRKLNCLRFTFSLPQLAYKNNAALKPSFLFVRYMIALLWLLAWLGFSLMGAFCFDAF